VGPHGTPGGVSITGTIFGVAGAILVGLLGVVIGMLREEAIMFIVISSLAAIGIESLLRVRWPGGGFVAKQGCNLAVTAAGALCAVLLALAFGY
jgi:uncharacterized membrane protein